jgi:type VI secretion system secreted protein Hcp
MSFDAFCYTTTDSDKIPGETQDVEMKKKKAFEVLSFELGAENTINIGSISAGGGAGKAAFKEFTITKKTDSASPGLFFCLVTGNHFGDLVIDLRRTGGSANLKDEKNIFLRFTFKLVMVQDISWSGSDGDDICEETVIFQYGAMQVDYRPQNVDGSHGEKVSVQWSRVKNEPSLDV